MAFIRVLHVQTWCALAFAIIIILLWKIANLSTTDESNIELQNHWYIFIEYKSI